MFSSKTCCLLKRGDITNEDQTTTKKKTYKNVNNSANSSIIQKTIMIKIINLVTMWKAAGIDIWQQ